MMLARQFGGEFLERWAGGAVARVPADLEFAAAEVGDEPVDVAVDDVDVLDLALALVPAAFASAAARKSACF